MRPPAPWSAAVLLSLAACTVVPADPGYAAGAASKRSSAKGDAEASGDGAKEDGSAVVHELGAVRPGAELTFEVPTGALGFVVSVLGDATARVGVERLVDPRGEVVVADYVPTGADAALALGSRGVSAFAVPSTDATATRPLAAGTWRLVVGGVVPPPSSGKTGKSDARGVDGTPVGGTLDVTVSVQRTSDGAFHGGTLDLEVYVPDGLRIHDPGPVHALHEADLATDAALAKRIDAFYTGLDHLFGIGRGDVSFHVLDASFASATTGDARAELIAQATARAPQALHVVLTNEMSYGGGAPLLGYSVGLPGTPNLAGNVRSAISVAVYDDGTAENDGITFLHEMGHFVGLMHTLDDDGTVDLLADTDTCDTRSKTCAAADDLMAPDGPLRLPRTFVSPSQVRVVRGSPLYRARPRATE